MFEKIIEGVKRLIFGNNDPSFLKRRIFLLILFITLIFGFIGNLTNILLGLDISLIILTTIAFLLILYYYIRARKDEYPEKYVNIPFILSILIFPLIYLLNGGYDGNTLSLIIVYFVAMFSLAAEEQRKIVFLSYLILIITLIAIQYFFPVLVIHYENDLQRITDVFVGNILYFILLYNLMSMILKNYDAQHNKVLETNRQLNELNEDLKAKNNQIIQNTNDLQINEERLSQVLQTTNDGVWEWRTISKESYFSPRYYTMLGYIPNEFPASFENWKKLVHPDDLPSVEDLYKNESLEIESFCLSEFRMRTKSGGWRWILNRYRVIEKNLENQPIRIIGVHTDITDRKITQEKLKESESRYRTIIETSPDGIITTNALVVITFMSDTALKMHGYEKLWEVVGRSFFEFIPDEEKVRARETIVVFMHSNQIKNNIFRILKKNGEIFSGQINLNMVKNNQGEITEIIGITRDITEYLKLEEQVQIQQRMDSVGTLAAGIAHNFNNLLTAITGYASLLEDSENLTIDQKLSIRKVLDAGTKAASLSRQIQSLSNTDVSRLESLDIYSVADEVFSLLEKTTDKMITKTIEFEKNRFFVYGNFLELRQVLLNLGTNSAYAIQEKGIKYGDYIRITAENCTLKTNHSKEFQAGEYIRISFEDNGKGMSEETKEKAFDPLFSTKTIEKNNATGLGLAMVYNIITRKHNGSIEIQSKLNEGTKIYLYLPKSPPIIEEERPTKSETTEKSGLILVIDDEEYIREVSSDILISVGYEVLSAADGFEGLKIFNERITDIRMILLDLTMPGMSGIKVMEEMLKIKDDTNILICSGHSSPPKKGEYNILSEAKGYLNKPFTAKQLLESVRNTIGE